MTHSVPTRRSSDLGQGQHLEVTPAGSFRDDARCVPGAPRQRRPRRAQGVHRHRVRGKSAGDVPRGDAPVRPERSEEHTSELQSLMRISYAVFCLKKKTKHKKIMTRKYITKA